jgi:exopolysaccharide biosynthesis polyprenyl glycosylphosphotransferase
VLAETYVTEEQGRAPAGAQRGARWQRAYIATTVIVDLLCMMIASAFAIYVRFMDPSHRPQAYVDITFILPVLWIITLWFLGGYDTKLIGSGSDEFRKMLNASLCLTGCVAIASYVTKFEVAREYVAITMPGAMIVNLGARYGLRKRLHKRRAKGYAMQRVVVVGDPLSVASLISELRRAKDHGLSVVGACLTSDSFLSTISDVPMLGGIDETSRAVSLLAADTVAVVACPELSGSRLRELIWELEESGTNLFIAPALLPIAQARTTVRPIAGLALLHMQPASRAGSKIAFKALFDRTAAIVSLLLLAPVFAAIVFAIKRADGGPVFFRQIRVGRAGKPFKVWKFRTMTVDAERIKARLAEVNEGNGALFKLRKDPRITRPGSWLRRYSLDELPQLINVFRGEMSLIGPRPALPEETAKYNGTSMIRRTVVKPGITGLWQVSGRSDLSLYDSERLDVQYVENWSLFLDLQILWKTIGAVIGGGGAY